MNKCPVCDEEFEDEDSKPDLPIDYERKLGTEEAEEEELPFLRCEVVKETFNKKCLTNIKLKKKRQKVNILR